MIRRRLQGLNVSPARTTPTAAHPLGTAHAVTTPYRVTGSSWARGYHTGEDYAAPIGSLAVSPAWGRVIAVGSTSWGAAYGTMVVVRTRRGVYDFAFCHLSRVEVAVGDTVRPGTVVGRVGITGNTSGPHLHFEARPAGGSYGSDVHPARVRKSRK